MIDLLRKSGLNIKLRSIIACHPLVNMTPKRLRVFVALSNALIFERMRVGRSKMRTTTQNIDVWGDKFTKKELVIPKMMFTVCIQR